MTGFHLQVITDISPEVLSMSKLLTLMSPWQYHWCTVKLVYPRKWGAGRGQSHDQALPDRVSAPQDTAREPIRKKWSRRPSTDVVSSRLVYSDSCLQLTVSEPPMMNIALLELQQGKWHVKTHLHMWQQHRPQCHLRCRCDHPYLCCVQLGRSVWKIAQCHQSE